MAQDVTIDITINGKKPVVLEEVTVTWTRFGSPGKMVFSVLDKGEKFEEGNEVQFKVDGEKFFCGYIFTIEREGIEQYRYTCYDAIRYLKQDDIFKMKKQTYTKALKTVCSRYGLSTGKIANTSYVRKAKVFNGCVLDMLEDYKKHTKNSTGNTYILYADFDKICLQKQSSLKTDYVFDTAVMEDFSYSSSIDEKVYTVVKIYKGSGKKMKIYSKTVSKAKKKYGQLTYVEPTKLKSKAKIKKKLSKIADAHDSPRKKLTLLNAFGKTDIRAGSQVKVNIKEGGLKVSRNMIVDTITHRFNQGRHTMDMNVFGGDFKIG